MGRASMDTGTTPPPLVTSYSVQETVGRSGARILVADDHMVNQQLAVMMLERLGHRADVVANGREAVEALGRVRYDLVFMDCQMPEMDGYAATMEIRQQEKRNNDGLSENTDRLGLRSQKQELSSPEHPHLRIPIIAMTANAMQGDREKCPGCRDG